RLAATELIDNFEAVLRDDFEGFPLPSIIDRIIISAGLSSAVKDGNPDNLNLMVRGSEVLARNLRHSLVDVAAILGSQPNEASRRDAHAYVHLLDKKREWEFEQITKLLAKNPTSDKGALISNYTETVTTLTKLKDRLQRQQILKQTKGLPS